MAKTITAPASPLEEYRAAVTANPNNAQAVVNLGWGLYSCGDYDEAVRQFQKAIELNKDNLDAHYGMGLTLKKAGKIQDAIAALEQTARLAAAVEDKERSHMLIRIIHGHINLVKSGDWNIGKEFWYKSG